MSRIQRSTAGWLPPLAGALVIVGGLSGCGTPRPPETCSWAATPRGVTAGDVVGSYTGTNARGEATAMTLTADGHFTQSNYRFRDWYSGTWLDLVEGTTWKFRLERGRIDKLRNRPGSAYVELDDQAKTTLKVGGTRSGPVLYDSAHDDADTCDQVHSLLRRA